MLGCLRHSLKNPGRKGKGWRVLISIRPCSYLVHSLPLFLIPQINWKERKTLGPNTVKFNSFHKSFNRQFYTKHWALNGSFHHFFLLILFRYKKNIFPILWSVWDLLRFDQMKERVLYFPVLKMRKENKWLKKIQG